jgi:hypothetical protein
MKIRDYALFALKIGPDLAALGKSLFRLFDGDVNAARAALKKIPDHWQGVAEERTRRDKELEELKAQGK